MKKWPRGILTAIGVLAGLFILDLGIFSAVYSPEYVLRVLRMGSSDVGDYMDNFPHRTVQAPPQSFDFHSGAQDIRVAGLFQPIFETDDLGAFLEAKHTQAFIVIQDDRILYENYFNGTRRDTLATSFSVAKSFTTALIGVAVDEGHIPSIDAPITEYLPELTERDARFSEITIRHLMLMASGLEYEAMRPGLLNGDDPLSTYFPDQRKAALEFTQVVDQPGTYFLYNKYHPQLLGMILERATGRQVAGYLEEKIWTRIGMEFDGSWSLDSEASGFEKMETGVNARPLDFAKFGRLYLLEGNWLGDQVIPPEWVRESTQVDPERHRAAYYPDDFGRYIFGDGQKGYYKFMWYGRFRENGAYDFYAAGDRGQFIYVSPGARLIIVRNGFEYGIPHAAWVEAFYEFAGQLEP